MDTRNLQVVGTGSGGRLGLKSNSLLRVFLATVEQWRFAKSSGDTNGHSRLKAGRAVLVSKEQRDRDGGQTTAEDSCAQTERPVVVRFLPQCQGSPTCSRKQAWKGMWSFSLHLYSIGALPNLEKKPPRDKCHCQDHPDLGCLASPCRLGALNWQPGHQLHWREGLQQLLSDKSSKAKGAGQPCHALLSQ